MNVCAGYETAHVNNRPGLPGPPLGMGGECEASRGFAPHQGQASCNAGLGISGRAGQQECGNGLSTNTASDLNTSLAILARHAGHGGGVCHRRGASRKMREVVVIWPKTKGMWDVNATLSRNLGCTL